MTIMPTIQSFEDFERETLAMILPPYVPKFGPLTWRDNFRPGASYPWLVKGIIPEGEAVLMFGATQTGKSFATQDLCLCIARGIPYFGHKTRRAGVIYLAFEGGKGFRKRQLAYAQHHGLDAETDVPMVVLTKRADLFSNDIDFTAICIEIDHLAGAMSQGLGLIVLDTWSAATPGSNENASEDVSKVRQRIMRLADKFKCSIIVVHHKPASSDKPRGHTSLSADFETTIDVDWDGDARDGNGRRIRRAKVAKQREAETDVSWKFVLASVELGRDEDGDAITSCVVEQPSDGGAQSTGGGRFGKPLSTDAKVALQALREALAEHGEAPLSAMGLPRQITSVVKYEFWRRAVTGKLFEPDEDVATDKARKRISRLGSELLEKRAIGRANPFVWILREPSA